MYPFVCKPKHIIFILFLNYDSSTICQPTTLRNKIQSTTHTECDYWYIITLSYLIIKSEYVLFSTSKTTLALLIILRQQYIPVRDVVIQYNYVNVIDILGIFGSQIVMSEYKKKQYQSSVTNSWYYWKHVRVLFVWFRWWANLIKITFLIASSLGCRRFHLLDFKVLCQ